MGSEVATIFVVTSALPQIWPLATSALRAIPLTFRMVLARTLLAIHAVAPEFALRTTWATMLRTPLFGRRNSLGDLPGAVLDGGGAIDGRTRTLGGRLPLGLVRTLPLGRTSLTAPIFAAAARAPDLDDFGLCRRRERLNFDSGLRNGCSWALGRARLHRGGPVGRTVVFRNASGYRGIVRSRVAGYLRRCFFWRQRILKGLVTFGRFAVRRRLTIDLSDSVGDAIRGRLRSDRGLSGSTSCFFGAGRRLDAGRLDGLRVRRFGPLLHAVAQGAQDRREILP